MYASYPEIIDSLLSIRGYAAGKGVEVSILLSRSLLEYDDFVEKTRSVDEEPLLALTLDRLRKYLLDTGVHFVGMAKLLPQLSLEETTPPSKDDLLSVIPAAMTEHARSNASPWMRFVSLMHRYPVEDLALSLKEVLAYL